MIIRDPAGQALGALVTPQVPRPPIVLPPSAHTPDGFRRWAFSGNYPDGCQVSLISDEILIDMNADNIGTHGKVKMVITGVLMNLVYENDLGEMFPDRTLVTHAEAGISNEPDACFVSWGRIESGEVTIARDARHEEESILGAPDWVLEVVSHSSVHKDTKLLKEAYFAAGVDEYWLVDARSEQVRLDILVRGKRAFVAAPKRSGWSVSKVFARRFSLRRRVYKGFWRYELLVAS